MDMGVIDISCAAVLLQGLSGVEANIAAAKGISDQ
ncbi:hypothetical protein T190_31295 [Sinorhizobium meliloti CCBAU 01290]|nr:hypothetical protein T190_31295 [Sinorhizobium meliloti CCBAU 01290]